MHELMKGEKIARMKVILAKENHDFEVAEREENDGRVREACLREVRKEVRVVGAIGDLRRVEGLGRGRMKDCFGC